MPPEEPANSADPLPGSAPRFDERLWVPWWWWIMAAAIVALLGAEVHIGLGWLVALVTYVVLGGVTAAFLLRWARRVRVDAAALHAGARSVPLPRITEVHALTRDDVRGVLARRPGDAVVLLLRGYVRPVIYVGTDGGTEVPPYLLISTRHPDELAAALVAPGGDTG